MSSRSQRTESRQHETIKNGVRNNPEKRKFDIRGSSRSATRLFDVQDSGKQQALLEILRTAASNGPDQELLVLVFILTM